MNIYVINESTVLEDEQIVECMPAFQKQCWHVKFWWGNFATMKFGPPAVEEAWKIVILDESDQPGALGYHDFTPGGRPIAKVFAKTDLDFGYNWTVTLSHELCEMLVDPWISAAMQTSNTRFYALELNDPVEADSLGYEIKGQMRSVVQVSDFVLPNWFIPGSPGRYDYRGHCSKPLEVLEGGYAQYYENGGWHQVNAQNAQMELEESARFRDRGDPSVEAVRLARLGPAAS